MKKLVIARTLAALYAGSAAAQQTLKIGIILPYTGQFADGAKQMDDAIKLYVQQHGDTVAGKKLEFVRKDTGGIAPDVAKRLAQELVVRDKVDILAGFVLTPNAMSAADVATEAKKFMVVMIEVAAFMTTVKVLALAETSPTASALGVRISQPMMSTLSRVRSSWARRLATSGAIPPVSLRMNSIFLPATVSPCCLT